MSTQLIPGDIAELNGLANAPQYNGCRGIVLGGPDPDQSGNLRHPIRLFDFNGKVLQVKVENLLLRRDLEEWKIERMGMTLMEVIKFNNNLGDEDNCHVFASKLWGEMAELGEIPGTLLGIRDCLTLLPLH